MNDKAQKFTAHMFEIAAKAIEADSFDLDAYTKKEALQQAYADFKESIGVSRVERDTRQWSGMMEATKAEYHALEEAKRKARNAKRRLGSAIDRYRKQVAADLSGNA